MNYSLDYCKFQERLKRHYRLLIQQVTPCQIELVTARRGIIIENELNLRSIYVFSQISNDGPCSFEL